MLDVIALCILVLAIAAPFLGYLVARGNRGGASGE